MLLAAASPLKFSAGSRWRRTYISPQPNVSKCGKIWHLAVSDHVLYPSQANQPGPLFFNSCDLTDLAAKVQKS